MFARFDVQARQVVVQAQVASRELHHNYIGTEHLLLGLLWDPEELPARILNAFGLTAENARKQVVAIVGIGKEPINGQIPFTPRAKRTLEMSLRESLSLGHTGIGPGHVLLGVVRDDEGVAMRMLLDANITAEQIRERTRGLIRDPKIDDVHRPETGTVRMSEGVRRQPALGTPGTPPSLPMPDKQLAHLLLATGTRALREERREYGLADLLAFAREVPDASRVLDENAQERGQHDA